MTSLLKIGCGCVVIMLTIMFQAAFAFGAEPLPEIQIPENLSPGLIYLLNLVDPENHQSFQPDKVKKLLEYMEELKDTGATYFADPKLGSPSSYFEFDIRQDLEHFIKYAFNPDIPGYLMMPSSMRLSRWKQVQGSDGQLPVLWNSIAKQKAPILVKGLEFVENTPDVFSGAYYSYHLYRSLILFKANNRRVIISISKQKDRSDVGKKGYVLGSDDNWDYFYSGKPGLAIPGLGWARSHIYDSYGINIYTEIDPEAPLMRCGAYKWLRAGWSNINVVKKHHIDNGIKRFAKSLQEIMEHPSLPSISAFSDTFAKINALSEDALKGRIKTYLSILENQYGRDYRPPRAWSPQILKDKRPWLQMSAEAMRSVLMVEYMKHAMGKRDAKDIVALFDFSK